MGHIEMDEILKVGDIAPNWREQAWTAQQNETTVSLADYRGKSAVLLLFYPADWSEVCTTELPSLEELVTLAGDIRLKTFGVSSDSVSSHGAFAREIGLHQIGLVSDSHYQISEAYGVMDVSSGTCRRATFLIDEEGIIRWSRIEPNLTDARPMEEIEKILEMVREWNGLSGNLQSWRQERQMAVQLPRPPLAPPSTLYLRFWGTRGSIPVSGVSYNRYGGNTSCVSITSDTGHLYVFDCGSGARELGNYLASPEWLSSEIPGSSLDGEKTINGYILLSHTHWDHIQGFPFFAPVFRPENRFNIIAWSNCSQTIGSILAGQMEHKYFPVKMEDLPSQLNFYSIQHGPVQLDGALVRGVQLNHPTLSTAYRFELAGKVIVYATDHEPKRPPHPEPGKLLGDDVIDPRLVELAHDADILIHDAQYSSAELAEKTGWGHSSVEVAVDAAVKARVKNLILFHHDPAHDDDDIDKLCAAANERAHSLGHNDLAIEVARDGLVLEMEVQK
jgi:peroxiredoxin/phosphoribosyl 1,2-cyclic phosphodiesterase